MTSSSNEMFDQLDNLDSRSLDEMTPLLDRHRRIKRQIAAMYGADSPEMGEFLRRHGSAFAEAGWPARVEKAWRGVVAEGGVGVEILVCLLDVCEEFGRHSAHFLLATARATRLAALWANGAVAVARVVVNEMEEEDAEFEALVNQLSASSGAAGAAGAAAAGAAGAAAASLSNSRKGSLFLQFENPGGEFLFVLLRNLLVLLPEAVFDFGKFRHTLFKMVDSFVTACARMASSISDPLLFLFLNLLVQTSTTTELSNFGNPQRVVEKKITDRLLKELGSIISDFTTTQKWPTRLEWIIAALNRVASLPDNVVALHEAGMSAKYLDAVDKVAEDDNVKSLLYEGLWRLSMDDNVRFEIKQHFENQPLSAGDDAGAAAATTAGAAEGNKKAPAFLKGLLFQLELSEFHRQEVQEIEEDLNDVEDQQNAVRNRRLNLDELLRQEEDLVKDLKVVTERFVPELVGGDGPSQPERLVLLSNTEALLHFHETTLLPVLREASKREAEDDFLEAVLFLHEAFLEQTPRLTALYTRNSRNSAASFKMIDKYKNWLEEKTAALAVEHAVKPLRHYLQRPRARASQYHSQISKLIHDSELCRESDESDSDDILEILRKINSLVKTLAKKIDLAKELGRIQDLEETNLERMGDVIDVSHISWAKLDVVYEQLSSLVSQNAEAQHFKSALTHLVKKTPRLGFLMEKGVLFCEELGSKKERSPLKIYRQIMSYHDFKFRPLLFEKNEAFPRLLLLHTKPALQPQQPAENHAYLMKFGSKERFDVWSNQLSSFEAEKKAMMNFLANPTVLGAGAAPPTRYAGSTLRKKRRSSAGKHRGGAVTAVGDADSASATIEPKFDFAVVHAGQVGGAVATALWDVLRNADLRVWADATQEKSAGTPDLDEAAKNVAVSSKIVVVLTEELKRDVFCQSLLLFAAGAAKRHYFLCAESGAALDGWLSGVFGGGRRGGVATSVVLDVVVGGVGDVYKDAEGLKAALTRDRVAASIGRQLPVHWTRLDVQNWLRRRDLERVSELLRDADGAMLQQLVREWRRSSDLVASAFWKMTRGVALEAASTLVLYLKFKNELERVYDMSEV